ncbi:MAG: methyltransferase domain-containing protein [Planctomycetaceae bacterium]|nr:methyltransferase domain-containing protein [Planctomycetaceae bacterium]
MPPQIPELLPDIPGGWTEQEFAVGADTYNLIVPTDPDAFLDDATVAQRNAENDYMPYWAFMWPSAPMAAATLRFAPWKAGSRVLEVGCGLGLVGLAGLKRGDQVVFSDYDELPLNLVRENAIRNGLGEPETLLLDWRIPQDLTFDAIVGCEVTYDAALHSILLEMLKSTLSPNGVCWLSDPGRMQAPNFLKAARDFGFRVTILDQNGSPLAEPTVQQFQIFELRHPQQSA